jgi:hypothetical protein
MMPEVSFRAPVRKEVQTEKKKTSQPGHLSGSLVFRLTSENDFTESARALSEEVGGPS